MGAMDARGVCMSDNGEIPDNDEIDFLIVEMQLTHCEANRNAWRWLSTEVTDEILSQDEFDEQWAEGPDKRAILLLVISPWVNGTRSSKGPECCLQRSVCSSTCAPPQLGYSQEPGEMVLGTGRTVRRQLKHPLRMLARPAEASLAGACCSTQKHVPPT